MLDRITSGFDRLPKRDKIVLIIGFLVTVLTSPMQAISTNTDTRSKNYPVSTTSQEPQTQISMRQYERDLRNCYIVGEKVTTKI